MAKRLSEAVIRRRMIQWQNWRKEVPRLRAQVRQLKKGAETMETLLSVLLTLWWKKPADYFRELKKLWALSAA